MCCLKRMGRLCELCNKYCRKGGLMSGFYGRIFFIGCRNMVFVFVCGMGYDWDIVVLGYVVTVLGVVVMVGSGFLIVDFLVFDW